LVWVLYILSLVLELLVSVEAILFGVVLPGFVFILKELLLQSIDAFIDRVSKDTFVCLEYFSVSFRHDTIEPEH